MVLGKRRPKSLGLSRLTINYWPEAKVIFSVASILRAIRSKGLAETAWLQTKLLQAPRPVSSVNEDPDLEIETSGLTSDVAQERLSSGHPNLKRLASLGFYVAARL
jgi:hypothetical protein